MKMSRGAFAGSLAAALTAFTGARSSRAASPGETAVNRFGTNTQLKSLGVFDVHRFGARGDGVTDDTASIQRAIDAAAHAGGGFVYLPNGIYLVASAHHLVDRISTCLQLRRGVILRGQSRDGAIIKLGNGVPACVVACSAGADDCGIMLLTLDGNREHQVDSHVDGNQCALFTYQTERNLVMAVSFVNAARQGFYNSECNFSRVDGIFASNCGSEGFSLSSSHYGKYDNIIVRACGQTANPYASGVYISGGAIENTVTNVFSQGNVGNGISFASVRGTTGTVNNTFIGFSSVGNGSAGVYVGSGWPGTFVSRNKFIGLTSRLNASRGGNDITLEQANDNVFVGCTQYNSRGGGAGLYLLRSENNRFDAFETYDDQPRHTQAYGILEGDGCTGNLFTSPVFRGGFLSAPYRLRTTVIRNAAGA